MRIECVAPSVAVIKSKLYQSRSHLVDCGDGDKGKDDPEMT